MVRENFFVEVYIESLVLVAIAHDKQQNLFFLSLHTGQDGCIYWMCKGSLRVSLYKYLIHTLEYPPVCSRNRLKWKNLL